MEKWYLLRTKPRQEAIAEENLRRQGFNSVLPRYRNHRRKGGKWTEAEEALFPGYLFIHVDIAGRNCAPIRSTRGVLGFVRFGLDPVPVPAAVIETLRLTAQDYTAQLPSVFTPGDAVSIVAGSFSGLKAIFQAQNGEDRVVLLLDLLGRTTRVTLHRDAVVPDI